MTKRVLGSAMSILALLTLAACPADSQRKEAAETGGTSNDRGPDEEAMLVDVAAGEAFYVENSCADCHVEGVDDPFPPDD